MGDKYSSISVLNRDISYKQIFTVVFSFILGIAVILIIQNYIKSEIISFSTIDIINFLFSIALSSVSIFLAIVAIMLSRSSEKAVIERSDESIRLQNEIYLKTIDTLERIELSTGITEKRIDDIVSGRVKTIFSEKAVKINETEKNIFLEHELNKRKK